MSNVSPVAAYDPGTRDFVRATQIDVARGAAGAGQTVAIGGSSTQSTAMPAGTRAVRLVATVDCWVEIGANPTAAANTSFFLPATTVEYLAATVTDKVAVLQSASSGSLYVRPTN